MEQQLGKLIYDTMPELIITAGSDATITSGVHAGIG
jgi:hypothetical protein